MSVVDDAWRRIEAWLATHTPATLATLRPPAALDQVVAAEAELGLSFPADLTASLRRHDGATLDQSTAWTCFELPPFYRPLPVEELRERWRTRAKVTAQVEAEHGDMSWHWDRRWIPVAGAAAWGRDRCPRAPGAGRWLPAVRQRARRPRLGDPAVALQGATDHRTVKVRGRKVWPPRRDATLMRPARGPRLALARAQVDPPR